MDVRLLCLLCISLICIFDFSYAIRWLSLQHSNLKWTISPKENAGRGIRSGVRSPCTVARRRYGLAKLQTKLCRTSMESMPHVQSAAVLAADTCKNVFGTRRWNCSSIDSAPYLTPDLTRATREQAYVYAISSATLVYTMARACSSGLIHHCTCATPPNNPPSGNFKWGGCGDNFRWGMHFAKRFVDTIEKLNAKVESEKMDRNMETIHDRKLKRLKSHIAVINLHNNKVGRRVIVESLSIQCKCHGVSGSCSIKTCWKAMPPLRQVGERLLRKFTNAKEVTRSHSFVEIEGIPDVPGKKKPSYNEELVFLTKSPDYCTRDERLGSVGTVGRKCNVTSNGTDSCRQLCCGRGYRTVVEEKVERCECKYYYCCYVKCNTCRSMTLRHECS